MLLRITRGMPRIRGFGYLTLRFLKPLCCDPNGGSYILPIWPRIRMLVDPWDCIEGVLALLPQYYDSWELAAVAQNLPEGGTFVDVGANVGAYSLWAARHGGLNANVIAIEPAPDNYARLCHNVELNGLARIIHEGTESGSLGGVCALRMVVAA
jgi:hypothetical protein